MAKRVIVLDRADPSRWNVVFWVPVPAARQVFYAKPGKTSAWSGASQVENDALVLGAIAEFVEVYSVEGTPTLQSVQEALEVRWAALQATLAAANPWIRYGTFWDGASWTLGGVS